MKITKQIGFLALLSLLLMAVSCNKTTQPLDTPILGHWGCEQYVSHRMDSTAGVDRWDTLYYDIYSDTIDYELFFYNTGKGLLKLNSSPAFIKEFSCDYKYDTVTRVLEVEGAAWLYAIYGSLTSMENHAEFQIETITDSTLVASWTNHVSEPIPFFERFFLKRIDSLKNRRK